MLQSVFFSSENLYLFFVIAEFFSHLAECVLKLVNLAFNVASVTRLTMLIGGVKGTLFVAGARLIVIVDVLAIVLI